MDSQNTKAIRSHRLRKETEAMRKPMACRRRIERIEENKSMPLSLEQELDRLMREF